MKDSTKALLGEYLDVVKKSLKAKLKETIGEDFEFSQDMDDLFVTDDVFAGLDSEFKRIRGHIIWKIST